MGEFTLWGVSVPFGCAQGTLAAPRKSGCAQGILGTLAVPGNLAALREFWERWLCQGI